MSLAFVLFLSIAAMDRASPPTAAPMNPALSDLGVTLRAAEHTLEEYAAACDNEDLDACVVIALVLMWMEDGLQDGID